MNDHVTVSVVSHRQNGLVNQLLEDLVRHCSTPLRILITENVPDSVPLALPHGADHAYRVITNQRPKGFGANHNAAFKLCDSPVFFVVNPDIRIDADPFPVLTACLKHPRVAAVGPLVHNLHGQAEDSARRFPTVRILLRKLVHGHSGPDYPTTAASEVDWVAGMFSGFKSDAFRRISGFDESYFLYYEDVDICRRLRAAGYSILYEPAARVIHDARRESRRNARLMMIHLASALRYLTRRRRNLPFPR